MSTYLYINLIIISIPLLLSFDKRVSFYKKWKYAIPAIILPAIVFIVWDIWFTAIGVWSFNTNHLIDINIFNLPIEEILFFITVPYASMFIYETIKSYWPSVNPQLMGRSIFVALGVALLICGIIFYSHLYTSVTFLSLAITIFLLVFIVKVNFLGRFLISYLIVIIPFTIFNGMLTGTGLNEPVVLYNNAENLDIRMLTIPIEDIFYGMLLILLNIFLLELFRKAHKT